MKRLNIKLAVSLVIAILVVGVGVHVLHGVQTERNAGGLLDQARTAYDAADYSEAINMADRYLKHRVDDPEGQTLLANAAHAIAKQTDATPRQKRYAYHVMEKAVRVNNEDYDLRRTLLQYLFDNFAFRDALDHAKMLQAAGRGDADVDMIVANSYARMGEFDKSIAACEKLTGYDVTTREFDSSKASGPDKVAAYALLAVLLDRNGDDEAATQVIDQLVAANEQSHEAQLESFKYWRQNGKIEKARESLDKAYQLAPDAADVLVFRFELAVHDKDLDTAENLLTTGVEKYPKDERMYLGLAAVALRRKEIPQARKVIEQGLAELPENHTLLAQLFDFQIQLGDTKNSKKTMERLRQAGFPAPLLELFEGQHLMAELDYSAAIRKLEQARTKLQQSPQHLSRLEILLARCKQAVGEHRVAQELLEGVNTRDGSPTGKVGLATAYIRAGKIEQASQLLETVATQFGESVIDYPEVWGQLIHVRAMHQLKLDPAKRDWSKIDQLVERLKESGKLTEPGKMLLDAEILTRKNQLEDARSMLFAASKRFPTEPQVWARLILLEGQMRGPDVGLQLLQNAPQEIRDSLSLQLVRINLASRLPGSNATEALVEIENNAQRLKPEEINALRLALAQEYRRRGAANDARRLLELVMADRKDDHISRWMYFDVARDAFDVESMQRMAQEFRTIRGEDSEQAKLAEAATKVIAVIHDHRDEFKDTQTAVTLTAADKARLAEARRILEDLTQTAENWHEPHRYLADIESLENNRDAEIKQLQAGMDKGPLDSNHVRRLYELLFAAQRFTEAEKVQPLLVGGGGGVGLEKAQIEVLLNNKRLDEAKVALDKMKPAEDASVEDHIWYAYAQRRVGNLDAAAGSLRSALQADPKMLDAWVMLVGVLVSQQKTNDANTVIEEAKVRVPAAERDMVVAQCYEVVNDKKRAEQHYLAAVKAKPDDLSTNKMVAGYFLRLGDFKQGQQFLDAITGMAAGAKTDEEKEIVAWSRRARAVVLAMDGYWEQFQEADKLLREQDISQATNDDLLLRIGLMANRKEPASMRSALTLFEELKSRQPLQPNEHVAMARLYERVGEWSKAQDAMVAAFALRNIDPIYYLLYAEMLIRNGDINDVERWLDQYERVKKDGLAISLRATVRAKQERPREAAEILLKAVGPLPAKPEQRKQVANTAALMETLELHEHAEKMYRELARLDRKERQNLARYIGTQGKIDEAFAILDELAKEMPPLEIVSVGMNIMRARRGDLNEQHFAMLGRWYSAARQAEPNSLQVEMLVGDIWEVRGQLAKAEEVYRRVINRSDVEGPIRAMVANNLAFILSAQQKDLEEALKLINESMNVLGPNSDLIDTRGVVYLAMKRPAEAIADFKDAVLVPTAAKWVHLALAQHAAGDSDAARLSLKKAQDMNLKRHDLYSSEHERYDRMLQELGQ